METDIEKISLADTDAKLPRHLLSGYAKLKDFKDLDEGGSASIRTCFDANLHRQVVVKMLHPHLQDSEYEQRRFLREARVTSLIQHPGTVPVYEVGRTVQGHVYFTMKKLEGQDLRKIIQKIAGKDPVIITAFPLVRLLDIFSQVCNAIAYAHNVGVIHRDLKPANILIGGFGEVMVLDWGLAKVWNQEEEDEQDLKWAGKEKIALDLTQPGKRYGTPLYMSPEQAKGLADIDERTDVFNLGSILYEILTLQNLVWGQEVEEVLKKILEEPIIPPRERSPNLNIPMELEAICMKALARDRDERYQSVLDLVQDVQNYMRGEALSVCDYSFKQKLAYWEKKNILGISIAGATLVGVVIGMLIN